MDDHDLYLTCKLSKCHHTINFSMNDKLARWFADGKNPPVRVFALITTSARWLLRSQMYSPNTCVHVVWHAPLAVHQHEGWYTAKVCLQDKWPTNLWEKHAQETLSMWRQYNVSPKVARILWIRCVYLIKYYQYIIIIYYHKIIFC